MVRKLHLPYRNNSTGRGSGHMPGSLFVSRIKKLAKLGGQHMRDKAFSKKEFIRTVTENVKSMYRKTLKKCYKAL